VHSDVTAYICITLIFSGIALNIATMIQVGIDSLIALFPDIM